MKTAQLRVWETRFRRAHCYWVAVALWMLLIGLLSLTPGLPGGVNSGVLAHMSAYSLLGLLWWLACRRVSAALLLTIGYGAAIELLQTCIPYRTGELPDIAINSLAALLGVLPGIIVQLMQRRS